MLTELFTVVNISWEFEEMILVSFEAKIINKEAFITAKV
jgi:hypothetical protein